ncbi:ankyrin repeat domain-containing protein [Stenotrophomonas maltophilia]|jgi:ankyrin repeat protein|uniref:ankyrin repeat domain-containing protein n=1 Tax=Stenotrophomonas maltophilia TaxID=40324 RepID=UPI000B4E763C|nr:ankyrin repeat domain-containing protein [Stenotrophomonas maltophilia]MBH1463659.1 ankyrin repeat domain-containing protein [Stenotrophomonas maltophilia]MBH1613843.1 ankyrin repeat domain-containing protein [Stenotrophomonas maltophilia]MBN5166220.1 ankyrin repeat domain-containing protein [Stenotrophomonas maltophilia]MCO7499963.1 ankyrin repeat domain-containing protein [Stenotrophomonas maltophilia]OWQ59797.1 hypothetical protein CEE59_05905 [Stenotrophomonas maltophilia]
MSYFNQRYKSAIIDNNINELKLCVAQYGANAHDESGITPLHYAVLGERTEATAILLDNGANVDAEDIHGVRAFDLRKPMVNNREQHRLTAHQAAALGDIEQIRAYIALGGDVNTTDHSKLSILQHACMQGHADIVDELVCAGADCRNVHPSTTPPVHLAALSGSPETLKKIMDTGADPCQLDPLKRTAMHLAARSGSVACLELLASHSVNDLDMLKQTPLDTARQFGREQASQWLEDHGAQSAPSTTHTINENDALAYKQRLLGSARIQYEVGRGDKPPRMCL